MRSRVAGSVHILASQEPVSCRETQAWNVNAGSNSLYIYTLAIEVYTCENYTSVHVPYLF